MFKTSRWWGRLGMRRFRLGGSAGEHAPNQESLVVLERTRVGFLVGDADGRQEVDDHARLYFQLACQLIDANFAHTLRL
jgi:hypothetical protein